MPDRRTVSPEFFSWVCTRRLLSRHSCPVRSPSFSNQKRRNYQWVEKRFGCYHQEQFNLHWENSVSDRSQCIVNNRKFKGLFTWRWGTPGRWGNPLRWRNPPVHMISHFKMWSRLHYRWGDPPRRVARSTRPGNPLSRVKFCHVNVQGGVTRPAGVRFVIHQIRPKFILAVVLHHYYRKQ